MSRLRSPAFWWPVLLWGLFAVLMVNNWAADPYDPTLTGTDAYGHNGENALQSGLIMSGVELGVFMLLFSPGTPERSLWRYVAVYGLLSPWWLLSVLITMHAGGIIAIHLLWLTALGGVLWLITCAALWRRMKPKPMPVAAP